MFKKHMCMPSMICKVLMVIGALNWGLVGLGMLLGKMDTWNVVRMVLGSMPTVEGIVYLLVGIAGLMMLFGCRCKKCSTCATCGTSAPTGGMGGQM